MRGWVLACAIVWGACAWAQGVPENPSSPSKGGMQGGIGISVDLRALFRGVGAWLAQGEEMQPYLPGQLVAVWDAGSAVDAQEIVALARGRLLSTLVLPALGLEGVWLDVDDQRIDDVMVMLRSRYPAAVVDRNALAWPQQFEDHSGERRRYVLEMIGARHVTRLGRPVRIGVLDGRPDPAVTLDVSGLEMVETAPGADAISGHGTALACLLACHSDSGFAGLARGASLLWASILTSDHDGRERTNTVALLLGLNAVVNRGAEVILASVGTPPNRVVELATRRALGRVRAMVAAAGNGVGPVPYPAAIPGVLAVAAVDAQGRPWVKGHRGRHIVLAAPGVDVWLPIGGGRYHTGTSFAAPFVAAWVAQRLAADLPVSKEALCAAVKDLDPPGVDDVTGCGLMQWAVSATVKTVH